MTFHNTQLTTQLTYNVNNCNNNLNKLVPVTINVACGWLKNVRD